MSAVFRLIAALAPLAATPWILTAVAEGRVDLGGGEKDLTWVMVWGVWAFIYALVACWSWYRGIPFFQSLLRSAFFGLVALVLAALVLAAFGQLGVAGLL